MPMAPMRLMAFMVGLLSLLPGGPATAAAQSGWVKSEQGDVRLIAATTTVGDSGRVQLGLQFQPKPGWKIYWRSPGDAGYPPSVDWKGSGNLSDVVISWPAPHRFAVAGLQTMGYQGELVLPMVAMLADPTQPLTLRASVDYLTCEVACVPLHADLELDLPAGPATASPHVHLIGRFLARVPGNGVAQGLGLKSVEATDSGKLKVVVTADPPLTRPDLFVERADQMQFGSPKVTLDDGGRRATFLLTPVSGTGEVALADQDVTLTVVDGERAMEVPADVLPARPGARLGVLLATMGIALLGGLILNVMPCVLPVLSIKVLSVLGQGGAARSHVRGNFLATAAGIEVSFLVLAVVALTVKAAGAWVGWGVQFQQPLFLTAMVIVVVLFGANLWGLFEIPLPGFAGDAAGGSGRRVGHFAEGAFATLLATPCSAPFVGTALGFALARGPLEIVCIFAALGLGMASPYLTLAMWPGLAIRLPRPGRWMQVVRRLLGLVLLGTAVWLLGVLASISGLPIAAIIGGMMVAVFGTLAAGPRLSAPMRVAMVAVLSAVSLVAALEEGGSDPSPVAHPDAAKGAWQPFDPETIPRLVAENKVVLVDVTAEWCLTCQVNKAAVINRDPVASRLKAPGVVTMKADWTRPNDDIGAFLTSFGRYGVPFDVVYGPGAPDGIVLPELLNSDAVVAALDKARGTKP